MGEKKGKRRCPQGAPAKYKYNAGDDDHPYNVKDILRHAFSSGWVQNSTLGCLGTLILLITAMATKTQVKAAAITFGLMGTAALWMLVLFVVKYGEPPNAPFAVAIETAWTWERRDFPWGIFCEYNKKFLSPVPIIMFVRIVNNQDIPSTMSQFTVEIELTKRFWGFSSWLKTVQIPEYMPLIWRHEPPQLPGRLELVGQRLMPILEKRPLGPHETIRGWVLLDVPPEYDTAARPLTYRIKLKDTAGRQLTSIDTGPTGKENVVPPRGLRYEPGNVDIGGFQVRHLADSSN